MEKNEMGYESPMFLPLQDVELLGTNGGFGAVLVEFVFVLISALAMVAVVNVGGLYNGVIGVSMTVSEYE